MKHEDLAINAVCRDALKETFSYNPETGVLIALKGGKGRKIGTAVGGVRVEKRGSRAEYRSLVVRYCGRIYPFHHVVWMIVAGPIPSGHIIDHDDGDGTNNRFDNLRLTTHQGNVKNQARRCDNTSGQTGVLWSKRHQQWLARITVDGKRIQIGLFDSKQDAIVARKRAENTYGFHENHGRSPRLLAA